MIAEYANRRVTERNLKGEILWEKSANLPVGCQRLANGNTFITCRNQLFEVDNKGAEVFSINRPAGDVYAGYKERNGQIVCLTNSGQCLRMDATGKELKSFATGAIALGGIDVLPNGNVLVANHTANRVVEYNSEGKSIWEAITMSPTSVTRLSSGNTLVVSQVGQTVLELDRTGKVVWQFQPDNRPWKARRR